MRFVTIIEWFSGWYWFRFYSQEMFRNQSCGIAKLGSNKSKMKSKRKREQFVNQKKE
jgi:hypothetical protein